MILFSPIATHFVWMWVHTKMMEASKNRPNFVVHTPIIIGFMHVADILSSEMSLLF